MCRYYVTKMFYAAVISYGLGLCKATWVGLRRDIRVQILSPPVIPVKYEDLERSLKGLIKVI